MNQSHLPLLGDEVLSISDIFGEMVVVQDYDQNWTSEKPRPHHSSFKDARGFKYGIRTPNGSNHWTRLILVKPSEKLAKAWSELPVGDIETLTCSFARNGLITVSATYMNSIGHKVIGCILESDMNILKEKAWENETLNRTIRM